MALIVKDRVQETSTTTGTGTLTLAGAVAGFQSFSVIGNANTTYYAIVMDSSFEIGIGTYTLSGTTLSRTTVLESSNAGSLVNFSAGTKSVFCTYPAEQGLYLDASGNAIALGTPASATLTNATGLPISTGVSGLGTGVATFLATPSSANLISAVTDETGTGSLVFATLPTFGTTGVKFSGSTSGTTTVLSGATAGTSVLTLPVATDTLVGKTTTDTLTNKTLTSPVIATIVNTGTLTLPTSTDTLVGKATTDTLTNKTVNLTSNTLSGTTAQFNTALSDGDFATLAGTETLTNKTLTTPVLGVATATSVNKVALTAPATSATLTIADGKTLTASNSLTLAGTDATTMTFPASSATVAGLSILETFTASQRGTVTTDNDGSFDMNVTNNFKCTPTATFALTFTNITAGQSGYVLLVNTSGYTVTAAATTKVNTSFLTTVSAAGTYLLSYFTDGTNVYVTTGGIMA